MCNLSSDLHITRDRQMPGSDMVTDVPNGMIMPGC